MKGVWEDNYEQNREEDKTEHANPGAGWVLVRTARGTGIGLSHFTGKHRGKLLASA